MQRERREVYMSLSVSDFDLKIGRVEKEIDTLNEKINKKKKEIAVLKKQRHAQELKERTKRNEEIISALEEKLGSGISQDMINKFIEFQKLNSEAGIGNENIISSNNENCEAGNSNSYNQHSGNTENSYF
jgi:oligoendopeptidase F